MAGWNAAANYARLVLLYGGLLDPIWMLYCGFRIGVGLQDGITIVVIATISKFTTNAFTNDRTIASKVYFVFISYSLQ